MSQPLPDVVIGFTGANWGELGFVPIWLWRLLTERGYTYDQIDRSLTHIIGPDYAEVNGSEWIDRMAAAGNSEMLHSIAYDTPPVLDIVDHAISIFLEHENE